MKNIVDIFVELRNRTANGAPSEIISQAERENEWFSAEEINIAIEAIGRTMLQRERLERWASNYVLTDSCQSVLIIMAGNIPLVGFFDLLCVLMAGDRAYVKPSHKDSALMEWIIAELLSIESELPIAIYSDDIAPDRVIATGGEAAVSYFESKFRGVPTLLRGSRHSIAVISGGETLNGLEHDIYRYSGLGCRNISIIFVPEEFDIRNLPTTYTNPKYRNNYRQNRALLTIEGREFIDTSISCLVESREFPLQISTIAYSRYSDIEEVNRWIAENDHEIQCIVADRSTISHPRRVDIGRAQYPTLYDYADGIDTMKFLTIC